MVPCTAGGAAVGAEAGLDPGPDGGLAAGDAVVAAAGELLTVPLLAGLERVPPTAGGAGAEAGAADAVLLAVFSPTGFTEMVAR